MTDQSAGQDKLRASGDPRAGVFLHHSEADTWAADKREVNIRHANEAFSAMHREIDSTTIAILREHARAMGPKVGVQEVLTRLRVIVRGSEGIFAINGDLLLGLAEQMSKAFRHAAPADMVLVEVDRLRLSYPTEITVLS